MIFKITLLVTFHLAHLTLVKLKVHKTEEEALAILVVRALALGLG